MFSTQLKSGHLALSLLAAISTTPLLIGSLPAIAQTTSSKPTTHISQASTTNSKPTQRSTTSPRSSTTTTNSNRSSHPSTSAVLRMGSRGDKVRQLQAYLKKNHFYTGEPNGIFDSRTRSAVIAFQKSRHLRADGVAGSQTLAAMR